MVKDTIELDIKIKQLADELKSYFSEKEPLVIKPDSLDSLKNFLVHRLSAIIEDDFDEDLLEFGMERKKGGMVSVYPKNMYTLLLMNGINIAVSNLVAPFRYETEDRIFMVKDGRGWVEYKKPMEYYIVDGIVKGGRKR